MKARKEGWERRLDKAIETAVEIFCALYRADALIDKLTTEALIIPSSQAVIFFFAFCSSPTCFPLHAPSIHLKNVSFYTLFQTPSSCVACTYFMKTIIVRFMRNIHLIWY
jgi:hypothetical protein